MTHHRRPRSRRGTGVGAVLTAVLLAGCGQQGLTGATDPAAKSTAAAPTTAPAPAPSQADARRAPAPRVGRTADSQRARFVPTELELPDGRLGQVVPVGTVGGELVVPEDGDVLGWWDGGAWAGDPFGSIALAGHIDTAEGVGLLAALTSIEPGQVVSVRGDGEEQAYRVTEVELVSKDVLATSTDAFTQTGPHRLVLITCWGRWRPELHSYDSNLVVTGTPIEG